MGSKIIGGGGRIIPGLPHTPPTSKYYQLHSSSRSTPQAPGNLVGKKVRGVQLGIDWNPVGRQSGRRPVKVHCR